MSDILLHIGYHKTATTWLQRFLFDNSAMGFKSPFGLSQLSAYLFDPHALDFDPAKTGAHLLLACREVGKAGVMPTISWERLSGNPHSGGYDSKELADRLQEVFPRARVLIAIREQKSMILSTYKQYVKIGGTNPLSTYLHPPADDARVPLFDFDHFKYHRLIQYYFRLFGRSNVLVLPYELFKGSPQSFIQRILLFCKREGKQLEALPFTAQANPSLTGLSVALKRGINRIVAERSRLNINPLLSGQKTTRWAALFLSKLDRMAPTSSKTWCDKQLQATIQRFVGDRYKESNILTAQMLDMDLAQYGYDL